MCVVIIKSLLYMYTKDLVNLVTCGPRILSRTADFPTTNLFHQSIGCHVL